MLKVALNTIKQANKQSSKKTYKVVSNLIQTLQRMVNLIYLCRLHNYVCQAFLLHIRGRPFNLKGVGGVMVFCFVQNFFFGQHKSQNIYLFCRAKREIFFQNSTVDYMTKTLNQIFFSSTKIRIFFSATLGIRIFFQKKTMTPPRPPLQVKWSFPYYNKVWKNKQYI